jgi:polyhydroxyalkanoate synthesis regulator phasin
MNWDGIIMGTTIALKLSEKEKEIVTQLNKKGVSNSELLRKALNQYFKSICESSSLEFKENNNFLKNINVDSDFYEAFNSLKEEINKLREQIFSIQQQIQNDVMKVQRQLYLLSMTNSSSKQIPEPIKNNFDNIIHEQVDEFLKKHI